MSPNTPLNQTEGTSPDFGQIFSMLRKEVIRAIEIASGTNYLGSILKPYPPKLCDNGICPKPEPTNEIIPMLWEEIYKLRDANDIADSTMIHLKNIIGS